MTKKFKVNNYVITIDDCEKYSDKELKKRVLDVVNVIKRKEMKDFREPISSFKTFKYMDKTRQGLEIVKAYKDLRDNRMHVICHRPFDNTYIVGLGYSPDDGTWNQGRYDFSSFEAAKKALDKEYSVKEYVKETKDSTEDTYIEDKSKGERIAEVFAKALKGECGPMGGKNPELDGNSLGLYSQAPTEWYTFNDDGSVDFDNAEEIAEWWNKYNDEGDEVEIETHFDSISDLLNSDLSWFGDLDDNKILEEVNAILNDKVEVKDVPPVNAPEEEVNITYNEKLKGGKNALTYGMVETAFKNRNNDGGKTLNAYVDVVLESLKDDIKNAQYIVSGEMEPTRKLLLEDYVKIEHLVEKAGLEDKLAIMKPLVDELSEKLNLNYWKQPKFKKSAQKQMSRKLRNEHRWDSLDSDESEYHKAMNTFSNLADELFEKYDGVTSEYVEEMKSRVEKLAKEHKNSIDWRNAWKDFSEYDNDYEEDPFGNWNPFKIAKTDSKITKSMKPVFLCTKSDLTASYNDAKNGKLPEVFEANLEKVHKDMAADFDRIMQGRDTYVEDPRIAKTLPEIIDLYDTALKYADDLEYTDYAKEFKYMLDTIKKEWGLAGE